MRVQWKWWHTTNVLCRNLRNAAFILQEMPAIVSLFETSNSAPGSRHLDLLAQQDSITSNLRYFPETREQLSRPVNSKRLKRRFWGTPPWDSSRVWRARSIHVVSGFFCHRKRQAIGFHLLLWNAVMTVWTLPYCRYLQKRTILPVVSGIAVFAFWLKVKSAYT